MAELHIRFDEERLRELCDDAVERLKEEGHIWVGEDLIEKLDELEFIRNINYYTNNSAAHDTLERFILSLKGEL